MSNVRTSQKYQNTLKKPADAPSAVGDTIVKRQQYLKGQTTTSATQRSGPKQTDTFLDRSKQRPEGLEHFIGNPNARVTKGQIVSTETPYQRARHGLMEKGVLTQATAGVKRFSDTAYLNFLQKVIDTPEFHSRTNIQKAAVERSKRPAAAATTAQRPATPAQRTPISRPATASVRSGKARS